MNARLQSATRGLRVMLDSVRTQDGGCGIGCATLRRPLGAVSNKQASLMTGGVATKDEPCSECKFPFQDIQTPYDRYVARFEQQISGETGWLLPTERKGRL